MRPKLEKLTNCRVVTYLYRIPNLTPLEKHLVPAKEREPEETEEKTVDSVDVAFPVYIYHFPTSPESALHLPQSTCN